MKNVIRSYFKIKTIYIFAESSRTRHIKRQSWTDSYLLIEYEFYERQNIEQTTVISIFSANYDRA